MTTARSVRGRTILALVTDAYGGHGGIAAYNRDVLEALALNTSVDRVVALPRLAELPLPPIPAKIEFDLGGLGGVRRYIARALRLAATQRIDAVYCAHINLAPIAWLIARLRRVPMVLCLYGAEAWEAPTSGVVRRAALAADHVISISRFTLDRFLRWQPDRVAETCSLLPNAIHLGDFAMTARDPALAERLGLGEGPVIMTLGRLDPTERAKGTDKVIAVLPRLKRTWPTLRYLIVGRGDDKKRLEALASELGVRDMVVFGGGVDEADKVAHYNLADAYVMPGHLEGFGFVFLEALACGLPCVGSAIDGSRDALLEGKLGALVDPAYPDALVAAVEAALTQPRRVPPELHEFDYPHFVARLAAIIDKAVPRQR